MREGRTNETISKPPDTQAVDGQNKGKRTSENTGITYYTCSDHTAYYILWILYVCPFASASSFSPELANL
jgi:hypothetical protein